MTGLGHAAASGTDITVDVTIKSVNCRGLEIKWRIPEELDWLPAHGAPLISEALERGRVDVQLEVGSPFAAPSPITLDRAKASALIKEALELNDQFHEVLPLTMGDILSLPGMIREERTILAKDEHRPLIIATVQEAVASLTRSRQQEGQALGEVLLAIYQRCCDLIKIIEASQDDDVDQRFNRFKMRIDELFKNYAIDEDRLHQELAMLAERSDFCEEIQRLKAHAEYFDQLCREQAGKGRKLDFLCQEMLRESNTLMSKAFDSAITQRAIELKAEIERIREQVQNFT